MLEFRTHINDQNKKWITLVHGLAEAVKFGTNK